jgi:3-(3-hydroxy-phenyl)propionate hydroxylase
VQTVVVGGGQLQDVDGWATRRYDAQPGTAYLLRPDQHVCARWRTPTQAAVTDALRRAHGHAN